jgi:drug/metabolite transporter (DMT)-like permease
MSGTLLLALGLIAFTGLCDTANHLGLKLCADSCGIEVDGFRSGLRFARRVVCMPLAWLSMLFALISLFVWLYALTMVELSLAFSLDSLHHVFIAIASRFFLRERVCWQRWLGTGLIMLGIVLVALSGAT